MSIQKGDDGSAVVGNNYSPAEESHSFLCRCRRRLSLSFMRNFILLFLCGNIKRFHPEATCGFESTGGHPDREELQILTVAEVAVFLAVEEGNEIRNSY